MMVVRASRGGSARRSAAPSFVAPDAASQRLAVAEIPPRFPDCPRRVGTLLQTRSRKLGRDAENIRMRAYAQTPRQTPRPAVKLARTMVRQLRQSARSRPAGLDLPAVRRQGERWRRGRCRGRPAAGYGSLRPGPRRPRVAGADRAVPPLRATPRFQVFELLQVPETPVARAAVTRGPRDPITDPIRSPQGPLGHLSYL